MKRKLIIILLFISCAVNAQNIISVTYQPGDMGVGLRYDRLFRETGVFIAESYGNYKLDKEFVKDHWKTVVGGSIKTENGYLCAGLSYHRYGERSETINKDTFYPLSFEFGGNVIINRIVVGIRMDVLKGEGGVDFGINF